MLILIGFLIIFGKDTGLKFCHVESGNMVILGILVGLSPCLPLVGVLLEIALLSKGFFDGVIYSFAFGIGTVLSPMLLIGTLAPMIGKRVDLKVRKYFIFACGFLLILMGLFVFYDLIGMFRSSVS
jgi:sulfite exporter TauE/SafE